MQKESDPETETEVTNSREKKYITFDEFVSQLRYQKMYFYLIICHFREADSISQTNTRDKFYLLQNRTGIHLIIFVYKLINLGTDESPAIQLNEETLRELFEQNDRTQTFDDVLLNIQVIFFTYI